MAKEQVKNRLEQDSIGKLMLSYTQTTFSIMIANIYTITDTFYVSKGIEVRAIGVFLPVLLFKVTWYCPTWETGRRHYIPQVGRANPLAGKR